MAKKKEKIDGVESLKSVLKLSGPDLMAEAKLRCDQKLISLYRKNLDNLRDYEKINSALAKLKDKIERLAEDERSVISSWLSGFPELEKMVATNRYKDGLKQIASKNVSKPESAGRVSWTTDKLLSVVQDMTPDKDGYLSAKELATKLKAQNIDILVKRLGCVSGELKRYRKEEPEPKDVAITRDFTFQKPAGKRYSYKIKASALKKRLAEISTAGYEES